MAGFFITAVLFPGLFGSMAIGGNAHAFSLWIAAGINCIIYFLAVWMICGISRRVFRVFRLFAHSERLTVHSDITVRRERRWTTVGVSPTPGTGSLHPVAIEAAEEATNLLEPSV